jgi:hypothetical protein
MARKGRRWGRVLVDGSVGDGARGSSIDLRHGVETGDVYGLDGGEGVQSFFHLVEDLMGLFVLLHELEAKGGDDLAVKVTLGEDALVGEVDRVIRVNMFPNCVGNVCRDVDEGTVAGG